MSNYVYNLCFLCTTHLVSKTRRKLNNPLAFKTNNTKRSEVHKISCDSCESVYIGQTEINVDAHFKEYKIYKAIDCKKKISDIPPTYYVNSKILIGTYN